MDMDFIRNRITEIRIQRGISEYQLSYELGHGKNYVHNIVTGHSKPSLNELLCLIDTLGVTPQDFFDEQRTFSNPVLVKSILDTMKGLGEADLQAILLMAERLHNKNGERVPTY